MVEEPDKCRWSGRLALSPASVEVSPVKKLTILVPQRDELRIARLVAAFPFASRHKVTRLALQVGLEELEVSRERLLTALQSEVLL